MAQLLSRIIIFIILMSSIKVMGEEKHFPSGKPEISLERKINRSYSEAKLVLLGSFQPFLDNPILERLSDYKSDMYVVFNVNKIYKGKIGVDAIKLQLPIYTPSKESLKSDSDFKEKSIELLSQDIQNLERKLEEGQMDRDRYIDALRNARTQILQSPNYSRDKMVIVPITRGDLDSQYRVADVPLEFGKKYILFILQDSIKQNTVHLFSWELDLYPAEKLRLIEEVLQTFKKETEK